MVVVFLTSLYERTEVRSTVESSRIRSSRDANDEASKRRGAKLTAFVLGTKKVLIKMDDLLSILDLAQLDTISESLNYRDTQSLRCCSKYLFSSVIVPTKPPYFKSSCIKEGIFEATWVFSAPSIFPFRRSFDEFWREKTLIAPKDYQEIIAAYTA